MPHYIRAYVPGGSYFFTVALLERHRCLLTEHVAALRAAFVLNVNYFLTSVTTTF
ncbi:MAG: hypothetical protein KDI73_04535 [Candidatus Competibacteraceae bacterium]|nr:hypothetical protein [Candidatus Competibacteraceae bacterium]